jgi:hypothetical protein
VGWRNAISIAAPAIAGGKVRALLTSFDVEPFGIQQDGGGGRTRVVPLRARDPSSRCSVLIGFSEDTRFASMGKSPGREVGPAASGRSA